jgi:hypothetical protein
MLVREGMAGTMRQMWPMVMSLSLREIKILNSNSERSDLRFEARKQRYGSLNDCSLETREISKPIKLRCMALMESLSEFGLWSKHVKEVYLHHCSVLAVLFSRSWNFIHR